MFQTEGIATVTQERAHQACAMSSKDNGSRRAESQDEWHWQRKQASFL